MKAVPVALAVLALMTLPAAAAECTEANFADSGAYAVATAKSKARFMDDEGKTTASYVLPGDEVVVIAQDGGKACVQYASVKSATQGWVSLSDLGPLRRPQDQKLSWRGKFVRDELGSFITLKPGRAGKVKADGEAYWAMSLEMAKQGGMNIGEAAGEDAVKAGALHVDGKQEGGADCSIDLRLLSSRYLLVGNQPGVNADLGCWGHNVSFDGLYVRVSK